MAEPMLQRARVNLGRYQLAYRSSGSGRPTVLLEAGGGCSQDTWATVFDPIAEFTSVISYDRAGVGASDREPRPRSCQDLVQDLHDLLLTANISEPYVLVGHSFGGEIVRLYAHRHRQAVVGMVLVDAVHHDQNSRALALMPLASPDDSPRLANMREILTRGMQVLEVRY